MAATRDITLGTQKKVLIVSTSASDFDGSPTGLWLEELAAPYKILTDAGVEIEVASVLGGEIPVDAGSLVEAHFTEDCVEFMEKYSQVLKDSSVYSDHDPSQFDAVIFPGGHGTVVDFPGLNDYVEAFWAAGKIVGAVCHGPEVFANTDGMLQNRKVTGFSNTEETQVGMAEKIPFLLEDKLKALGGEYSSGDPWTSHVVVDGRLVTGQNPQSSVAFGHAILEALQQTVCQAPETSDAVVMNEFGAPEVLQVQSVPTPTPGPTDVVLQVFAFGVNPVETYLRAGTYRKLPTLPYTPGRDAAGVVVSVGAEVTTVSVGDRVFCDTMTRGAYAQYFRVPAADVLPLHGLSYAQGAAVGVGYRTAYRALFEKAQIQHGDVVLVRGASGGVGLGAIEMAVNHGCSVIGTSSSEEGRQLILAKGAMYSLNHSSDTFEEDILNLSPGGVTYVLEMLANVNLHSDLQILAPGGAVVVIGNRGTIEINPRDLMMKETRILGMLGGPRNDVERKRYQSYLVNGIKQGFLQPQMGVLYDFADVGQSHVEVIQHTQGTKGKIIVAPFGSDQALSTN